MYTKLAYIYIIQELIEKTLYLHRGKSILFI